MTVHNHDIDPSCEETLSAAGVLRGECMARSLVPYTGPPIVEGVEHYPGCGCGRCQKIRAAKPEPPVPLAYWPCCGATLQLVRTLEGFAGQEKHSAHCQQAVGFLLPKETP